MIVDLREVERFLYREARLMDENAYDDWLALWTEELTYWVPCEEDDLQPENHISFIYDDRARLRARIARLKSGNAHAQDPKSRLCRVVSNIEVGELSPDDLEIRSKFVLGEVRRGKQDVFMGRTIHKLRRHPDGLRMSFKKVMLVNSDEFIDNLTFLL
ncbi:MAG: aromatic-ring-hydroxylating dioxygenase subunit beta [Candidatus Binataceae bacterium]